MEAPRYSEISPATAWLEAVRPRTLPAGAAPVLLGTALAFRDGQGDLFPAGIALFCALLIQVATNFINEIYDNRRGADTADRLGPLRSVAAGLISERAMVRAALAVLALCFAAGMVLVYHAGWPIFAIGTVSLLMAWMYTGGPFPLAYKGLGDVFVFIFFGLVATVGTYYAQALHLTLDGFLVACLPGAFSALILQVNNIRDRSTDVLAGKKTLAVRLGRTKALALFDAVMLLGFAAPMLLIATSGTYSVALCLLSLPMALRIRRDMRTLDGKDLNPVLGSTGKLLVAASALLAAGLVVWPLIPKLVP